MILAAIREAPLEDIPPPRAPAVAEFHARVQGACLRVEFSDEPGALRAMQRRAEEAVEKYSLRDAILLHRKGLVGAGESLTYAAAAADHRRDALAALDYLLGGLKGLAKKTEG